MNKSKPNPLTWKSFPWHAFLFAVYPILALLANNIIQVVPEVVWEPLAVSVASAGILLVLLWLVFRDWQRAALLTTILLVLFFSYGHVYTLLKAIQVSGFFLFRHRTLIPLWAVLAGLGILWTRRKKWNPQNITTILNIIGLGLLAFPIIQISTSVWRQQAAFQNIPASYELSNGQPLVKNRPDIYYIILDAYGRSDRLQELYQYDNSAFLASLEEMGFYVADCSQSNYAQTELSLASSLNFNYLEALSDEIVPTSDDRSPLWPLIKYSTLRQFLELQEYKVVAFETGYYWTQLEDADLYLTPLSSGWQLNEFDYLLIRSTAGRILFDVPGPSVTDSSSELARRRTTSALAQLAEMPSINGTKFVFAHLVIPHPPFVFGPNGESLIALTLEDMSSEDYARGYIDQTIYINAEIERLVAKIIARSPTPPIIIIQGDHGPTLAVGAGRMDILNAYYLPGVEAPLYESISPVNTFRVVLNTYFGQDLPLLPDVSRYSTYEAPYDFQEIPNICTGR